MVIQLYFQRSKKPRVITPKLVMADLSYKKSRDSLIRIASSCSSLPTPLRGGGYGRWK